MFEVCKWIECSYDCKNCSVLKEKLEEQQFEDKLTNYFNHDLYNAKHSRFKKLIIKILGLK